MATVVDASGNTPAANSDQSNGGNYDLQAVNFKGTQHSLTLAATHAPSPVFSRLCRSIRIAPLGNCHWEVGKDAVATATSPYLANGAVEIVPVGFGDRASVIQEGAVTTEVIITEDK